VLETLPDRENLATLRHDYETAGLELADLAADPVAQFQRWYDDAAAAGLEEPNAMTLGTVDEHGYALTLDPWLRGVDSAGSSGSPTETAASGP
jgi:pyridoxamine 5'-phosphate oxidase